MGHLRTSQHGMQEVTHILDIPDGQADLDGLAISLIGLEAHTGICHEHAYLSKCWQVPQLP